jgi:transcriptional regulator with XRE-family HTH domain
MSGIDTPPGNQVAYQHPYRREDPQPMAETAFGKYLRSMRVNAGLSLRQVAEQLGVTHVYLGEVERGMRGPLKRERWTELVRVIKGVTIDDLDRAAAATRPVKIDAGSVPGRTHDVAVMLARRIQDQGLDEHQIDQILRILGKKGLDDDED